MRTRSGAVVVVLGALIAPVAGCAGGDDEAVTDPTETQVSEFRRNPNPGIAPPGSKPFGHSYAEWTARFWEWGMEYPLDGHPFAEDTTFVFSKRQFGEVWYWGAPGAITRDVSIPFGKAIFLSMRDAECSSLESPAGRFHGDTEEEQRACAKFWADHIRDVFCVIDDRPVKHIANYRVSSTQIDFTAPTPWIFGDVGGAGTSVGDGYYLMLYPMTRGEHTIHYGGTFHFEPGELGDTAIDLPKDVTINVKVGHGHDHHHR